MRVIGRFFVGVLAAFMLAGCVAAQKIEDASDVSSVQVVLPGPDVPVSPDQAWSFDDRMLVSKFRNPDGSTVEPNFAPDKAQLGDPISSGLGEQRAEPVRDVTASLMAGAKDIVAPTLEELLAQANVNFSRRVDAALSQMTRQFLLEMKTLQQDLSDPAQFKGVYWVGSECCAVFQRETPNALGQTRFVLNLGACNSRLKQQMRQGNRAQALETTHALEAMLEAMKGKLEQK